MRQILSDPMYVVEIVERRPAISLPETAILLVSGRGSRPLARSNSGSPRFTDFLSLCACSESSLTNLIGSGLNLLCLHSHSKPECRWAWPGVPIFPAHDKRDPWGRGWTRTADVIDMANHEEIRVKPWSQVFHFCWRTYSRFTKNKVWGNHFLKLLSCCKNKKFCTQD